MAKKRKAPVKHGGGSGREPAPKRVFASPFTELGKLVRQRQLLKPPLPLTKAVTAAVSESTGATELDEAALLRQALDGVRQLSDNRPGRMPVQPSVSRTIVSEDAEVLARL